jgi:hypothetical protein
MNSVMLYFWTLDGTEYFVGYPRYQGLNQTIDSILIQRGD